MISEVVKNIVFELLRLVGAAVMRRHIDEWEEMERAAELMARQRLGPRPGEE